MNPRIPATQGAIRDLTVYVIDDDPSIRELLAWLMKRNGIRVETFATAKAFLASCGADAAGCLVLDLYLPGMSGLDLQQYLKEAGIDMPVIFLSGRADVQNAVLAVKGGAIDFVEKPFDYRKIVELVSESLRREAATREVRAAARAHAERLATLTQREREVLDRVIDGKVNRLIAEEMRISIKTVEAHRARIMEKLAVDSVAQLVRLMLSRSPGEGTPAGSPAPEGLG